MSCDEFDAAWDNLYVKIGDELYPDHYVQAVEEFKSKRLRSFYEKNPFVMRPAVDSLQLGKRMLGINEPVPALIFFATANELLLKATLLKPVVYGLVLNDDLADIVMSHAIGQTGFERYDALLSRLFSDLTGSELKQVAREGEVKPLLEECKLVQRTRNDIIHKGKTCSMGDANTSLHISVSVFELIVRPVLCALGLSVIEKGEIVQQA